MKRVLISIVAFVLVSNQPLAQSLTDSLQLQLKSEMHNPYLQRAKQQKTAATVLLAGGVAIGSVGLLVSLSQLGDMFSVTKRSSSNEGEVLSILGAVMTVSSIPFFVAASENKRKATLGMGNSTTSITPDFQIRQTSIKLSIPL